MPLHWFCGKGCAKSKLPRGFWVLKYSLNTDEGRIFCSILTSVSHISVNHLQLSLTRHNFLAERRVLPNFVRAVRVRVFVCALLRADFSAGRSIFSYFEGVDDRSRTFASWSCLPVVDMESSDAKKAGTRLVDTKEFVFFPTWYMFVFIVEGELALFLVPCN